jgi:hypothetical protein
MCDALLYCVYCLCVNVWCTAPTGCQLNCGKVYISYHFNYFLWENSLWYTSVLDYEHVSTNRTDYARNPRFYCIVEATVVWVICGQSDRMKVYHHIITWWHRAACYPTRPSSSLIGDADRSSRLHYRCSHSIAQHWQWVSRNHCRCYQTDRQTGAWNNYAEINNKEQWTNHTSFCLWSRWAITCWLGQ